MVGCLATLSINKQTRLDQQYKPRTTTAMAIDLNAEHLEEEANERMNAASARRHECNTHLRSSRRQALPPIPASIRRPVRPPPPPPPPNPPWPQAAAERHTARQRSTSLASKEGPKRKIVQERGAETQNSTRKSGVARGPRPTRRIGPTRRAYQCTPRAHQGTGPPKLPKHVG